MDSSLINASNLTFIKKEKKLLDNVSLTINPKDFITIVGPNGAGKSLLIKCLLGLLTPHQGTIKKAPRLSIGYVPQNFKPDKTIPCTVWSFLKLCANTKSSQIKTSLDLLQADIEPLANQQLASLSGGEMQKVLLAAALLKKPQLLVLDEPELRLDLSGRIRCYQLIEKIYRTHDISILMVSHDLHMVTASSQQVICLYHHICCSGAPTHIKHHPQFAALFGKQASETMAVYPHQHDHAHQ